jgi:Tol biopolymer transport system component
VPSPIGGICRQAEACPLPLAKIDELQQRKPEVVPNGTQIAFDNRHDILLINVDGSHLRRITTSTAPEIEPTWSPDGTKIAYAREHRGRKSAYDLWIMNADWSRQRVLARNATEPEWSRR